MSDVQSPRDPQLFTMVCDAVAEGLRLVRKLEAEGRYIGTQFPWYRLSWHENGMPWIMKWDFGGPTDYSQAFGRTDKADIRVDELPAFQDSLRYIKSHDRLRSYLAFPGTSFEESEDILDRFFFLVDNIVDRYMHVYKDSPFDEERVKTLYLPLEAGLFEEQLPVDILVPILFLQFDPDSMDLGTIGGDKASIERMGDDFQLARAHERAYGPGVHESVLGAATHALTFQTYTIRNDNYWTLTNVLSETGAYPLAAADAFFAGLRIKTGLDTGYAQLLARPVGWINYGGYKANLPSVEGTSIRRYPNWFENYYWNTPSLPKVGGKDVRVAGHIANRILQNDKLRIASQRLNQCFLRESEEDSVLDTTIAMEMLLSDDNRTEMTYKLALRMAALAGLTTENMVPLDVFKGVKHVYGYRSSIVHGSPSPNRKRELTVDEAHKVPSVTMAIRYLRMALDVLVAHPQYLDTTRIDEDLLLSKAFPQIEVTSD